MFPWWWYLCPISFRNISNDEFIEEEWGQFIEFE